MRSNPMPWWFVLLGPALCICVFSHWFQQGSLCFPDSQLLQAVEGDPVLMAYSWKGMKTQQNTYMIYRSFPQAHTVKGWRSLQMGSTAWKPGTMVTGVPSLKLSPRVNH
ncbi:hypothetical protein JZ751_008622 [Albula glossodonta]|uniref:Uncharacterized protein n=1 Tax=Albula glossodonta TaxID=121402 RepID=A0A8T2P7G0_9TELE|nr:hypothetical protein JZ751_008622 [Albula glossodonta]